MGNNLDQIKRCFQPRQWFRGDGDFDPNVLSEEESLMWVYRKLDESLQEKLNVKGNYCVGYFMPDGTWQTDSCYESKEEAAARVRYLNGGN